jgi:hypothetical protein
MIPNVSLDKKKDHPSKIVKVLVYVIVPILLLCVIVILIFNSYYMLLHY